MSVNPQVNIFPLPDHCAFCKFIFILVSSFPNTILSTSALEKNILAVIFNMKKHFLMSEKIDDDTYNDDVIKYTEMALTEASNNPNDQKSEFFLNTNDVFIQPFLKAFSKSRKIDLLKSGLIDNNFDTLFYFHDRQFVGLFAYQINSLHHQTVAFLFRYYLLPSCRRKFINYKVFLYFIEYCRNNGIDILKIGNSGKISSSQRTDEQQLSYGFLRKLQEKSIVKNATINLDESGIIFGKE